MSKFIIIDTHNMRAYRMTRDGLEFTSIYDVDANDTAIMGGGWDATESDPNVVGYRESECAVFNALEQLELDDRSNKWDDFR